MAILNKTNFIGFMSATVMTCVMGSVALGDTLSDAMASAYKHSGLLMQNQALLRAADDDLAIAKSALRPTLNYVISNTWSDTNISTHTTTTSAALTAEFLLFDFGRTKAGVAAQKETVLATRDNLISIEQQVLLRAVRAYLNVRSALENVDLQVNAVRVLTQELRASNDRYDVGEVTRTDVALAQSRLAAARANEALARGNLVIANEEYRAVTGALPKRLSSAPKLPKVPKTLKAAKAQARQRHPDILAAQHNVAAADLAIAIAKGAMKPSLVASGQTKRQETDGVEFSTNSVGITLQGPIYSGGRLSAGYRQAVARHEGARAGLLLAHQGVEQAVANAWAQIQIALASLEATERQISASRIALSGAREEASLGSRTTLDVLNAEQELLNAQARRIDAMSDRQVAAYSLLSTMGLLTAEHLHLGVVIYDPEAYYNSAKSRSDNNQSVQGRRLDSLLKALGKN